LEDAESTIAEAGFDMLNAIWPERDGFQADLDVGRAGSESSNPHLKQTAREIESAMMALALALG
jgi:chromosome partitioning protein